MDVRDLLGPKTTSIKRPPPNSENTNELTKLPKHELIKPQIQEDSDEDQDGTEEQQKITESTFIHYSRILEKRARANQEARTKFADQPEKFMNSELELQETLEEMQILASEPTFYYVLAQNTTSNTLLSLISHENVDMSLAIIDLLNSLLDSTGLIEAGPDSVDPFLKSLLDGQLVELLSENLTRLNETNHDEADGIFNTIKVIDNLLDVKEVEMIDIIDKQGFFDTLITILKDRNFNRNKLYASEVLDTILMASETIRRKLGDMDGIDFLLQKLAVYKRHDPATYEEAEMLQNLFNCLCTCLMISENKERFLRGEGIQLMNLMLRERHLSRDTALRVLDYAMCISNDKYCSSDQVETFVVNNCIKFVEILGLRTIFPLFMHSPKAKMLKFTSKLTSNDKNVTTKSPIGPTTEQMEEHIINIIAALLRFSPQEIKDRVLNKFVENDHEKIDRIVELHMSYLEKMELVDKKLNHIRFNTDKWSELSEEEIEEEIMLKKMEAGQITLQMIDCIILSICVEGHSSILERVLQLFKMRNLVPNTVVKVCKDYLCNLGDSSDRGNQDLPEYKRISYLNERFSLLI